MDVQSLLIFLFAANSAEDDLIRKIGFNASKISSILSVLEIKGLIKNIGRGHSLRCLRLSSGMV
ncbi:hypothetical protein KKG52_02150 [Patescibacteria group bacterium]|nr:hypothetical protein [Patescibacteria group bacterium]